jgi:hypothetical protein
MVVLDPFAWVQTHIILFPTQNRPEIRENGGHALA